MHQMVKDGCLPDRAGLVGSKKAGKLVSAEGSQGNAQKTENARDLNGKLNMG